MKILGVEFDSNKMHYVLIEGDFDIHEVLQKNRLELAETRSRDSLVAFQDAIRTLYNATVPDILSIKAKPEAGQMRAGAAALKMEGVVLANAPCKVVFVSGLRINQCEVECGGLQKYLQPAYKAAVVTLTSQR
ncbi:DUF3010 family protein [Tahibacter soli]|uniref:DUF3010 family protein n=1 Tax=Tahibacter soli TaxID=2983605 RepID=A0A9X4BM39_9GAMM|nr:DUF3010 family protein [Tahibacter soli]MDC8015942.1 DUF3010 family protein [Tahibacter soli]